jgi:hypothetical protein
VWWSAVAVAFCQCGPPGGAGLCLCFADVTGHCRTAVASSFVAFCHRKPHVCQQLPLPCHGSCCEEYPLDKCVYRCGLPNGFGRTDIWCHTQVQQVLHVVFVTGQQHCLGLQGTVCVWGLQWQSCCVRMVLLRPSPDCLLVCLDKDHTGFISFALLQGTISRKSCLASLSATMVIIHLALAKLVPLLCHRTGWQPVLTIIVVVPNAWVEPNHADKTPQTLDVSKAYY